jgi:hypothetical protein
VLRLLLYTYTTHKTSRESGNAVLTLRRHYYVVLPTMYKWTGARAVSLIYLTCRCYAHSTAAMKGEVGIALPQAHGPVYRGEQAGGQTREAIDAAAAQWRAQGKLGSCWALARTHPNYGVQEGLSSYSATACGMW